MQTIRQVAIALLLTLALCIPQIALPNSAFAVSPYDDTIQVAPNIEVQYTSMFGSFTPVTFTGSVSQKIQSLCTETQWNAYKSAISSAEGHIFISQDTRIGYAIPFTQKTIYVGWYTGWNAHASFSGTAPHSELIVDQIDGGVYFYMNGNGHVGCSDSGSRQIIAREISYNATVDSIKTEVHASDFMISLPSNYEGLTPPPSNEIPPSIYAALGDSFSSGEGNSSFESGTDNPGVNECHRSSQAYPRLLQADPGLYLEEAVFAACSGATTSIANLENPGVGNWNEGSQLDHLSTDTDIVTITIGGNDIKFAEFATACVFGSCGFTSTEYQESWSIMTDITRDDNLPLLLATFFSDMSSNLWINPDVKVYVVGYPYVMTLSSWENRGLGE